MSYIIVNRPQEFEIWCDCTNGCKKCSREFGGNAVPDQVNIAMSQLHKDLVDMQHLARDSANIEKIRLLIESSLSFYEAASNLLRNPPKYKLVPIEPADEESK